VSKTKRWYQISEKIKKLNRTRKLWLSICSWNYINPFYYKHEKKYIRIEEHRKYRHRNRIRIDKGMDILYKPKTNGWLSH